MTITDFALLTTAEQLSVLHLHGVYLCKRTERNKQVLLYQYNQLYIEIYYRKYRQVVEKIRCSEDIDILNPYLDSIRIEDSILFGT